MNHQDIVEVLKGFTERDEGVKGLFSLGSYAREELGPNSDLDMVLWVKDEKAIYSAKIILIFGEELKHKLTENDAKYILFISNQLIKLELSIVNDPNEVERLYIGSRITEPSSSILVDKTGELPEILGGFIDPEQEDLVTLINHEITKFLISFESASAASRRGDVFQSYFQYNLSLTRLIRLLQLELEDTAFLYAPKRILKRLSHLQLHRLERLNGTLRQYQVRERVEMLATEFRYTQSRLYWKNSDVQPKPDVVNTFLQDILDRDLVWNLRDVSWVDPELIRLGRLFRSPTLSRFAGTRAFDRIISENGIQRIIDLRLPWEADLYPYSECGVEVISVPMTIRKETDRDIFKGEYPDHVLLLDNSLELRRIFSLLAEGKTTLIHCHSGKDRTGVVIFLILSSIGVPSPLIERDFLASGMNLKKTDFTVLKEAFEAHGAAVKIVNELSIDNKQIANVKKWLIVDG